ncbi:carbohydrate ABC transporter permease [Actinopolymorpha sp. NPDC004070]|uniref:carbohydrate ABC transporter permease n=1 Tax=Actinopolymorpha sp. NPDC004070 TaxID=3154548 RepID=UPI0033A10FD6
METAAGPRTGPSRPHGDAGFARTAARTVRVAVLLAFVVFFGVPLIWLLLAATRTNDDLLTGFPIAFGSFHNLSTAWHHLLSYNDSELLSWVWNSVVYSVGGLLLTLVACVPAGYALASTRFRGRYALLLTTLVVMIVPGSTLVLPLFIEVSSVRLLDTMWAVILPMAFFPFGVYLTYIYYATSLPPALLDAGRVDGCSEWQLFWSIALPLARPVVSLVAFFAFVANWNNYFLPFVMLTDDHKYNLPVGLAALIQSAPGVHPAFASELPIYGPEIALAGVVTVAPIAVIFLFSQRSMIAGIFGGAVKQ